MGTALALSNADFSANALKTISLDDITWTDLDLSNYTKYDTGFVFGQGGRAGEAVTAGVNYQNLWRYTEYIAIPSGAKKIKGLSNASHLMFGTVYNYYPALIFYDENDTYISSIEDSSITDVIATGEQTTANTGSGVKGNFIVDIPVNASKFRVQWLRASDNGRTYYTGLAPIVIDIASIKIGLRN